jgi:signal transduction histidine kinase
MAAEAGVQLEIDAPAELALLVDRTLVRQALANLIANAIEHTKSPGRIRLQAQAENEWITIAVTDTGCGIAPEHLPHVFNRFYRIEASRAASRQHAGLGLAIVKSIVDQHGGLVRLESRLGEGTAVRVQLPRAS